MFLLLDVEFESGLSYRRQLAVDKKKRYTQGAFRNLIKELQLFHIHRLFTINRPIQDRL